MLENAHKIHVCTNIDSCTGFIRSGAPVAIIDVRPSAERHRDDQRLITAGP